jgi:putative ABC transport system permease protein
VDELKYAVRSLQRQAGASAVTVAALACSIGGVAVTWAVLSATLIKPLDVADSDRLMAVGAGSSLAHSIAKSDAFSGTAVHGFWTAVVTTPNDAASRTLSFATPNFFSVLGVPVALGRDFNAVDDEPGRQPVAILSHRFWQTAFQADASVVGQRVEIASHTVEVVGVAPTSHSPWTYSCLSMRPFRSQAMADACLQWSVEPSAACVTRILRPRLRAG